MEGHSIVTFKKLNHVWGFSLKPNTNSEYYHHESYVLYYYLLRAYDTSLDQHKQAPDIYRDIVTSDPSGFSLNKLK